MTARREVELDAARVEAARRIAKERGLPSLSAALYSALADGVRLARSEEGRQLLPRSPGRTPGKKLKLPWTQPVEEYQEWSETLRAAGSSPRAVIGAWVDEYVRVNGDLPAMRWPFRGALLAASA